MLTGTSRRLGAWLLLGWFAAFWGESFAVRSCPMHGNADVTQSGHTAHQATDTDHSSSQAPETGSCDCVGDCIGGVSILLGASGVRGIAEATPGDVVAESRPMLLSPAPDQTRLPFANGPPASTPA